MKCSELLPFGDFVILRFGEELPSCLLPNGHEGDHLIKTSKGYFSWQLQDGYCRDCDCAKQGEPMECFNFSKVSEAEAQALLSQHA